MNEVADEVLALVPDGGGDGAAEVIEKLTQLPGRIVLRWRRHEHLIAIVVIVGRDVGSASSLAEVARNVRLGKQRPIEKRHLSKERMSLFFSRHNETTKPQGPCCRR